MGRGRYSNKTQTPQKKKEKKITAKLAPNNSGVGRVPVYKPNPLPSLIQAQPTYTWSWNFGHV